MSDGDARDRAITLASYGGNAISAAKKGLSDPSFPRRYELARCLAIIDDTRVVPALGELLTDKDPAVVGYGCVGLIARKTNGGQTAALKNLLSTGTPGERRLAAKVLAEAAGAESERLLQQLAHDDDEIVSMVAIRGLGRYESPRSVEIVRQALKDGRVRVWSAAASAYGSIAPNDPDAESAVHRLSRMLKGQREDQLIRRLSLLTRSDCPAAEQALLEFARNGTVTVRAAAWMSLGDRRKIYARDLVSKLAEAERHLAVQQIAIKSIGSMRLSEAGPWLLRLLVHKNAALRKFAAKALGDIQNRAATPTLISLLSDVDAEVRFAALGALTRTGHYDKAEEGVRSELDELARSDVGAHRIRAAMALRHIGDNHSKAMLARLRADRVAQVRLAAQPLVEIQE